jgi:coproporphyrinogen III oxidase
MSNGMRWFGGGIDLTPHYVNEDDARFFHSELKACCDRHHDSYYPAFKTWADDYFYIKHRKETRGVGGVFFDRLTENADFDIEQRWKFIQDIGNQFAPIYTRLMSKNKNLPFSPDQKEWQFIRRGRYAEFNLVWDKGTKFGLDTNGRTESILMSLPPQANWHYNIQPAPESEEQKTLDYLKKGIDWV